MLDTVYSRRENTGKAAPAIHGVNIQRAACHLFVDEICALMIYFRQAGLGFQKWQAAREFGCYYDIVEVLDDQYANRHVVLFDDGQLLRSDRMHWIDEFGRLMGLKFSKQPKWMKNRKSLELISALEFDGYWQRALKSDLREQQQMRSLIGKYQQPTIS